MRAWTPKSAVARSRRNIAAAIVKLRLVSVEWADVDGGIEREAEDLIRELSIFAESIEANINDRLAAGEQIGI
jgi:hypothetical protein